MGRSNNDLVERIGEALISHDIQARGIKADVASVNVKITAAEEAIEVIKKQIDELKALIAEAPVKFQSGVNEEFTRLWANISARFDALGELVKVATAPRESAEPAPARAELPDPVTPETAADMTKVVEAGVTPK